MRLPSLFRTPLPQQGDKRPRDNELDLFGLTHPGHVREENQDHFLLCTVHPQVVVHATSLPGMETLPMRGQRLATLMLVADGVGGGVQGGEASRLAAEAVTRYVASALRSYHSAGTTDDELLESLRGAALEAHHAVLAEAAARALTRTMATTLSLGMVVWPWLYVLQVGDSRCYVMEPGGPLRQVTRDQTIAQRLVDEGMLSKDDVRTSPLSHVLASAIGAAEALPVVTRVDVKRRGTVILVCSDGLTKHVTDAEIAEHLRAMQSAEQVCGALCQLALDRGGSDNVTIVIGRAREQAA